MVRITAVSHWSQACVWRAVRRWLGRPTCLLVGLLLGVSMYFGACPAQPAPSQPVKGNATLSASGGYARLVLKLDEDVDSEVTVAGTVLVIRFKRPVDVSVLKLSDAAPDYVGSARRDPDGSAIRLALTRKVSGNSMTAGGGAVLGC